MRRIATPSNRLKEIQHRILRRLLRRLAVHPAVTGFERGRSIVTNAIPHVGKAIVVRMDLKDFFESTTVRRIEQYFRKIGWNKEASALLVRFCTRNGGLPQGAPTSSRLSNLVNFRLDARLAAAAEKLGATYTRYADDLTFSVEKSDSQTIRKLIRFTKYVADECGYVLHQRRKLHIRRRHDRQLVTGLVVNSRVNLPRTTHRWLRAVEHRLATGQSATLSAAQIAGWKSLQAMVNRQSETE